MEMAREISTEKYRERGQAGDWYRRHKHTAVSWCPWVLVPGPWGISKSSDSDAHLSYIK
jgi:hypothetical protein